MDPKTVVFFCNWSAYPGLQLSENPLAEPGANNKMQVSMCSGRISPELVLEAFRKGAWGVLITACPEDKCEHKGNFKTYGRIKILHSLLEQMGVESSRLKFEWVDKGEAAKLQTTINAFNEEIKGMGPAEIAGLAA